MLILGCSNTNIKPERIKGTERYLPELGTGISVSQQVQFLVYAEIDSAFPAPPTRHKLLPAFHLIALDLETGAKTHYQIDEIPADVLTDYKSNPWLGIIYSFEPAGWDNEIFGVAYGVGFPRRHWIEFVPGVPEARVGTRPERLGCSDCPPPGSVEELLQRRGYRSSMDQPDRFSAAWRDGKLSEDLYTDRQHGDALDLVRVGPDGKAKKVARASRFFSETEPYRVRVSPDERYLAYAVILRFKVPIPTGGVVELFIRDMEKRRTYQVDGVYLGVSNLNWSHDSRTLFFGASAVNENGVYRVTLPD